MMIYNGKEYRNLQEQVQKNMEDIEQLQQGGVDIDMQQESGTSTTAVMSQDAITKYTQQMGGTVLGQAKTYTDTKTSATLSSLNTYINGNIGDIKTALNNFTTIQGTFEDLAEDDYTKVEGYFWASGHSASAESRYKYYKIPVNAGEKYYIKTKAGQIARSYNIYSSTTTFTSATLLEVDSYSGSPAIIEKTLTMPTDAQMLIVNFGLPNSAISAPTLQKYTITDITGATFDFDKAGLIEEFKRQNILYGKKLVTAGDSITYGADMDTDGLTADGTRMTYGWQIANRNHMTFVNMGISGSTMQGLSDKNGFSLADGRYTQVPADTDYLTILFGWNDNAYGTLGTINDTTNESYYGGYNVVLDWLITNRPNTTIILIVPFGTTEGHRNAVRLLANKWGVACFDMMQEGSPLHYTKEKYVGVKSEVRTARIAQYQADGAHPNYKGHVLIGNMLEGFMRNLACGNTNQFKTVMGKVVRGTGDIPLPTASQTTKGGLKVWLSGTTLNISTEN